jgi:uncharacterized protein
MGSRYRSFNNYLRGIFGERVQRIGLDAGFSCPNIDGTKSERGCSYCNNKAFVVNCRQPKNLDEQITRSMEFYRRRLGAKKFIAYFQAFSNTWAPVDVLKKTYDTIKKYPQIAGLFVSTRPDCLDDEKLKLISGYLKDYLVWLELGLQTSDEALLKSINRNHSYSDFEKAVRSARAYNINVCAHLIAGLPGSRPQATLVDVDRIVKLGVAGVKFHVFHLLKNTPLEAEYTRCRFKFLDRRSYVKIICDCLERLPPEVVIMRLVSTASSEYLIGPEWINQKHGVIKDIDDELKRRNTYQGCSYEGTSIKNP